MSIGEAEKRQVKAVKELPVEVRSQAIYKF
jgi:hypothetical protein